MVFPWLTNLLALKISHLQYPIVTTGNDYRIIQTDCHIICRTCRKLNVNFFSWQLLSYYVVVTGQSQLLERMVESSFDQRPELPELTHPEDLCLKDS